VTEFKQDAKGNWDIVFRLMSVLKGDQQQNDRTLTVNSLNPWREFDLPPGDAGKGRRYVYFLRGDDSFFALNYEDYEAMKKAGKL